MFENGEVLPRHLLWSKGGRTQWNKDLGMTATGIDEKVAAT